MRGGKKEASQDAKDKAVDLFLSGLSPEAAGAVVGYSGAAVRKWLVARGVEPNRKPMPAVKSTDMSGAPRACSTCGKAYPATGEFFYVRTRRGRKELVESCKECAKAARRRHRVDNPEIVQNSTRVTWHKNKDSYNKTRREKAKTRTPEEIARSKRVAAAWRSMNKEWLTEYWARRYVDQGDKMRAAGRAWRLKNAESHRMHGRAYRARKRGVPGWFTKADVRDQLERQGAACYWCGCTLVGGFHCDHYIPLSKGGDNTPENLVLACPTCNLSRGNMMPEEFKERLKRAGPAWMERRFGRPPTPEEVVELRARYAKHTRNYRARRKSRRADPAL